MPRLKSSVITPGQVGRRRKMSPEKSRIIRERFFAEYYALKALLSSDKSKKRQMSKLYSKVVDFIMQTWPGAMLSFPTPEELLTITDDELAYREHVRPPPPPDPNAVYEPGEDPKDRELTEQELATAEFIRYDYHKSEDGPNKDMWAKKMVATIVQGDDNRNLTEWQLVGLRIHLTKVCRFSSCSNRTATYMSCFQQVTNWMRQCYDKENGVGVSKKSVDELIDIALPAPGRKAPIHRFYAAVHPEEFTNAVDAALDDPQAESKTLLTIQQEVAISELNKHGEAYKRTLEARRDIIHAEKVCQYHARRAAFKASQPGARDHGVYAPHYISLSHMQLTRSMQAS
jgi:hypothetical protein